MRVFTASALYNLSMHRPSRSRYLWPLALILLALSACSLGQPSATATPSLPPATATPTGPQTLNICLGSEPSSLYLYGDNSASAQAVRQAIYDGPFDLLNYQTQPVLFESAPRPVIQSVTVHQGDLVVDATGAVRPLAPGLTVRQSGCRDGNCVVAYSGGDLQMDQVSVSFTLRAGLLWSDGTPLTADDSRYSFEVASASSTPASKDLIRKTASYTAVDDRTVNWVGLPGYTGPAASTAFWSPLPRHAWGAIAPADLLTNEAATRAPLGWGPYLLSEWSAGRITLTRNANYWRAAELLPHFATLNFNFIGSDATAAINALADGTCDVLLPSTGLQTLESAGMQGGVVPADSWWHLDFAVAPQHQDDGLQIFVDPPVFFADARTRQAVAQCINRDAIANSLNGAVATSYVPAGSAYFNSSAAPIAYDPAAANTALDQLGWFTGADGIRINQAFVGILAGVRFEVSLVTANDAQSLAVADLIKTDLAACGISLSVNALPAEEAFAAGPSTPVFGRNFDLALFAWPYGEVPACYLYLGEAVPGEDTALNKYGWGGWNVSGWRNADFDAACTTALNSLTTEPGYADAHNRAQAIFAEQLPALPLAVPFGVVAARPDFCNLDILAGEHLLQNLESYGYAEWCQ